MADIDNVREIKITYHQDTLYRDAVVNHGIHKPYKNYGYHDLLKALHAKKEEKAKKMAKHVAAMAQLDLEINYLAVKSERKRHSSGANADLKLLLQQHLQQLDSKINNPPSSISTPSSSSKRQRK